MVRLHWRGRQAHTVCPLAETARLTTDTPLWAVNMMWWDGVICRDCVPDQILSKAHADKVPWPWRTKGVDGSQNL